jgi:hypothetical protein
MIISLLPRYVPLDPGNPVDLFPGGGAMVVLIVIGIIAAVAVGIWRMTLVNTASKQLGLTDEQRLLAVTDEHGGAAVVAGAAIAGKSENDSEPADLPTRLAALQSALDQGLITPEEFASTRQRILDGA